MFENLFNLKLYLVGEYGELSNGNITWGVVGLFSTIDRAIEACKNVNYFYVPISVNKLFSPTKEDWVYPLSKNNEECSCGENCSCEVKENE